jgi:hypothetical protein
MAGFDNDRKATAVHDDLWARAVAVGDGRLKIAIVSVDLIGVFHDYLRGRMEERLGGTCVFLVGSIGGLMTPLGVKLRDADGGAIPADSFALAQAVGERAADAALDALKVGKLSASSALEHRSATVFVPLENRLARLLRHE